MSKHDLNGRREVVSFIGRRTFRARQTPVLSWHDTTLFAQSLADAATVRMINPDRWPVFAQRLSWIEARHLRLARFRHFRRFVLAYSGTGNLSEIAELWSESKHVTSNTRLAVAATNASESWAPQIDLEGAGNLSKALEGGRGAIVWASNFIPQSLIGKRALFQAGFAPVQLGSPTHGPSKSKFGIRMVNRQILRAEDRFLAERQLFDHTGRLDITRRLLRLLADNRVVLITNNTVFGERFIQVGFGEAAHLHMASMPLNLSLSRGVPLLTMSCAETIPLAGYRAAIGRPISFNSPPSDSGSKAHSREFAIAGAALQVRDEIASWLETYPAQWRGFSRRKKFETFGSIELIHRPRDHHR